MKKRVYESAVLFNAALDDEAIKNVISRIKETITVNGGEILETEDWGRKRLAYQVKRSKIGYYVIIRFNSQTDLIPKLERSYQLDENILRYLTIALTKDALEQIEFDKSQQSKLAELVEEIIPVPLPAEEDEEETTVKEE
ncbi:MAG: 30S ribosomal protein S6 [Ignavibacteriales bacterium]